MEVFADVGGRLNRIKVMRTRQTKSIEFQVHGEWLVRLPPIRPHRYCGKHPPCDVVKIESDSPYDAIINTADKSGCDLIAMASHGRRGVAAIVLGSETLKVLTHSKIPVLVYR